MANYQPLGALCPVGVDCSAAASHECCADPCGLLAQGNPGNNELNYAAAMADTLRAAVGGGFRPHALIDTGRNGNPRSRGGAEECAAWCNIRDAGCGALPTLRTADPELVDAYFWLKTPGENR